MKEFDRNFLEFALLFNYFIYELLALHTILYRQLWLLTILLKTGKSIIWLNWFIRVIGFIWFKKCLNFIIKWGYFFILMSQFRFYKIVHQLLRRRFNTRLEVLDFLSHFVDLQIIRRSFTHLFLGTNIRILHFFN